MFRPVPNSLSKLTFCHSSDHFDAFFFSTYFSGFLIAFLNPSMLYLSDILTISCGMI